MTGYQFARVHSYPVQRSPLDRGKANERAWTVANVLDEVARVLDACRHVENPLPPRVVGVPIDTLRARHDGLRELARVPGRGGRGLAKIRKDTHTLLSIVASYPVDRQKLEADERERATFRRWAALSIRVLQRYFRARGVRIQTVVFHFDESHWHMHLLGLPDASIGFNARLANPAWAARRIVAAQGGSARAQNAAAKQGYSAFHDHYHLEVGSKFGHQRIGRHLKRLSRREALDAQNAYDRQQAALAAAYDRELKAKADQDRRERTLRADELSLQRERQELAIAKAQASKLDEDLRRRKRELVRLKEMYREGLVRLEAMRAEARSSIKAFADRVRQQVYKQFSSDIARKIYRFFDQAEKDARAALEAAPPLPEGTTANGTAPPDQGLRPRVPTGPRVSN